MVCEQAKVRGWRARLWPPHVRRDQQHGCSSERAKHKHCPDSWLVVITLPSWHTVCSADRVRVTRATGTTQPALSVAVTSVERSALETSACSAAVPVWAHCETYIWRVGAEIPGTGNQPTTRTPPTHRTRCTRPVVTDSCTAIGCPGHQRIVAIIATNTSKLQRGC